MSNRKYEVIGNNLYSCTLDNGLKILYARDFENNAYSLKFIFNVGFMHDGDKAHISHLIEHLIDNQDYTKSITETWKMRTNAYTTTDHTAYLSYGSCEGKEFTIYDLLESYFNAFQKPLIAQRLEAEKQIIEVENRMRLDDAKHSGNFLNTILYPNFNHLEHFKNSLKTVPNISFDDVTTHLNKYYAPNNCLLLAHGADHPQKLFEKIDKMAQSWAASPTLPEISTYKIAPELPRSFCDQAKTFTNYIISASRLDITAKNYLSLLLLDNILSTKDAQLDNLFTETRFEKPLSYNTEAFIMPDQYILGISSQSKAEKTGDLIEAMKTCWIKEKNYINNLTEEKLNSIKNDFVQLFNNMSILDFVLASNLPKEEVQDILNDINKEYLVALFNGEQSTFIHGTISDELSKKYDIMPLHYNDQVESHSFLL